MEANQKRHLLILSAVLLVASCAAAALGPVFAWVECNTGSGDACDQEATARALVLVGVVSLVTSAGSLAAVLLRRLRTTVTLLAVSAAALSAWIVLLGRL